MYGVRQSIPPWRDALTDTDELGLGDAKIALGVEQPVGPAIRIDGHEQGLVLGQQSAHTVEEHHLDVADVHQDLPGGPAALAVARREHALIGVEQRYGAVAQLAQGADDGGGDGGFGHDHGMGAGRRGSTGDAVVPAQHATTDVVAVDAAETVGIPGQVEGARDGQADPGREDGAQTAGMGKDQRRPIIEHDHCAGDGTSSAGLERLPARWHSGDRIGIDERRIRVVAPGQSFPLAEALLAQGAQLVVRQAEIGGGEARARQIAADHPRQAERLEVLFHSRPTPHRLVAGLIVAPADRGTAGGQRTVAHEVERTHAGLHSRTSSTAASAS